MQLSLILVDENNVESDVLKVKRVLEVGQEKYAVVEKDENRMTFCKIILHFDGTMRLADIRDDEEFLEVEQFYRQLLIQ